MPIYEYSCPHCLKTFELMQKLSDSAPTECSHCHKGTPERIFSAAFGMHFKGEGFYCTDYKNKDSPPCCKGDCSCSKGS